MIDNSNLICIVSKNEWTIARQLSILAVKLVYLLCIPFSTPYRGDYGFEVSFQHQSKDTKSATWTVRGIISKSKQY